MKLPEGQTDTSFRVAIVLIECPLSGSDGRRIERHPEESPSRAGQRWRLTTARGNPRESATENTPPMALRGTGKVEMVR